MKAVSWCSFLFWLSLASESSSETCSLKKAIEESVSTVLSEAASSFISNINRPNEKQQITNDNNDNTNERTSHAGNGRCPPKDCADIASEGQTKNGVYRVWPEGWRSCGMHVYCDLENHLGGWTVIQRRGDYGKPKDYFYKRWRDYKFGFGNLAEDFWLGNEKIYHLTNQDNYVLRVDLKTKEGETAYAQYEDFYIEPETNKYKLNIYGYQGDAGDSLGPQRGQFFGTSDRDNDNFDKNCAVEFKGAWWYNKCHESNLNGLYHNGHHQSFADGVNWKAWKGYNYSYTEVSMKIRPANFRDRKKYVSTVPVPV